jgi:Na+-transporting NADH:ubiquinone oxidoreductase subunit C
VEEEEEASRMTPAKVKKHITTIVFTLVITFVCMSLVSAVALSTRAQVELNKTLFMKQGVRQAAGLPAAADTAALLEWTDANVRAIPDWESPAYFAVKDATDPTTEAIVHCTVGPGLWGKIDTLVGFQPDRETLAGIAFLAHSETPGRGARMDEPWFIEQFKGCKGAFTRLIAEEAPNKQPGELHGITGATITSTSIKQIVNDSMQAVMGIKISEGH